MKPWLLVILLVQLMRGAAARNSDERSLAELLLMNYDAEQRMARPVLRARSNVTATVTLALQNIQVNEFDGALDLAVMLSWRDPSLVWNPADFGGVETLAVPTNRIWMPDVTAFTSLIDVKVVSSKRAVVWHNGTVDHVFDMRVIAHCETAGEETPSCTTMLGSYVYSANQLDLKVSTKFDEASQTVVSRDRKWNVAGARSSLRRAVYDETDLPQVVVEYKVHLKRNMRK